MSPQTTTSCAIHLLHLICLLSFFTACAAVPDSAGQVTGELVPEAEEPNYAVYAPRILVSAVLGFLAAATLVSAVFGMSLGGTAPMAGNVFLTPPQWVDHACDNLFPDTSAWFDRAFSDLSPQLPYPSDGAQAASPEVEK